MINGVHLSALLYSLAWPNYEVQVEVGAKFNFVSRARPQNWPQKSQRTTKLRANIATNNNNNCRRRQLFAQLFAPFSYFFPLI